MLAEPKTGNTAIAKWTDTETIPELEVASEVLDDLHDVHFGICSQYFNKYVAQKPGAPVDAPNDLHGLGPRILDISKRGGRTAEDSWRVLQSGSIKSAASEGEKALRDGKKVPTPGFLEFFTEFNSDKKIKSGKHRFPAGAKIGCKDVGGQLKYEESAEYKTPQSMITPGYQYGTRWSKAALEHAMMDCWGMIHFHLDGLGNIKDILDKTGDYSHNVTGRELRFVYRNWKRFQNSVLFYNGYTRERKCVMVHTPWENR
jgi:hypothetical protein